MTTKRYFYTDPLAAAWMAKHFGMMFIDEDQIEIFPLSFNHMIVNWGVRPIYIHPDSLHLLEPQIGDYVYSEASKNMGASTADEIIIEAIRHSKFMDSIGFKIIQRDGKAFMWPESEEA